MPELSSEGAAQVMSTTRQLVLRYVNGDKLQARRQGTRGIIRIDTDELKSFADEYGFLYNDQLAAELSE